MRHVIFCCMSSIFVAISGCASPWPIPVDKPSAACLKDKTLATCQNESDHLDTLADVIVAFRAYAVTWRGSADGKRQDAQASSEVSFYGALVGAIGGIVKSPQTAIAGTAVAAAGGIFSQRYRLDVQAANYDLAANAMQCMYDYSSPLLTGGYTGTNEQRDNALADLTLVRNKLRTLQNTFQLGTPDISKLTDALKNQPKLNATDLVTPAALKERADGLKDGLAACVAQMSG
ncbi:hypothetical protein P0D69_42650 [Paraburkholderia sediminicola]|uniref:hypothetical protein n=1 Tax=Paraburkholderia sediminicola TaxID=458836 RepID=UPI0038BC8748